MKKILFAAAAVVSLGAFAAVPFRLGVAGYTFHKRTLDDALSIMQKADVHYLCVKDFHLPFSATDADIAAFREKCASYGVTPYAIGPVYVKDASNLRPQFEFAKRLGVKTIVGVPYEPTDENDSWNKRRGSRALLLEIDKLVKEFDIKYAIHNHGPASPEMYPDVEYGWNLVKDLDPRVGFCIDVGWEYGCDKDPAETIRSTATAYTMRTSRTSRRTRPTGSPFRSRAARSISSRSSRRLPRWATRASARLSTSRTSKTTSSPSSSASAMSAAYATRSR